MIYSTCKHNGRHTVWCMGTKNKQDHAKCLGKNDTCIKLYVIDRNREKGAKKKMQRCDGESANSKEQ